MPAEKKLDRRVRRTRRLLRQALLELIIEHGYDDLTITDITQTADLRRATFYLHFKHVDELLLTVLREIFDETAEAYRQREAPPFYVESEQPHTTPMFEHVAEHATLYKKLLSGRAGAIVQGYIRDYLAQIKLQELADLPPESLDVAPEMLANYVAGTEAAMIAWWLEHDMPHSPEDMAALVQRMMMHGLNGVITQPES